MDWNNKMRERRLEVRLTQQQVAEILGCTQGTISQYERGAIEPPIATIKILVKLYKTTADDLLMIDPEAVPTEEQA